MINANVIVIMFTLLLLISYVCLMLVFSYLTEHYNMFSSINEKLDGDDTDVNNDDDIDSLLNHSKIR